MRTNARDALTLPIALVVSLGWLAALGRYIVTGEAEAFLYATGPFGLMCGWLFVRDTFRRAEDGDPS